MGQTRTTQHFVEVDCEPTRIFDLLQDVEKWPRVFPPCQGARVIKEAGEEQLVEIDALANGVPMSWRSSRRLRPECLSIDFAQVKPSPLLRRMEGTWRVFPAARGAIVCLEHRFQVKRRVSGLVSGVNTWREAEVFMERTVQNNSTSELQALRRFLEADQVREADASLRVAFADSLVVYASPSVVFNLLRDASAWPGLLPHCEGMKVIYDDGRNQELEMTVRVRDATETIRTVRYCVPERYIRYFQPEPPPVLAMHTGEWSVEALENGVRVTSWHEVRLRPDGIRDVWGDIRPDDALERVKSAISANSIATLNVVKNRAESLN